MHRGWVKLWRKTVDSAVWANDDLFRLWIWCLLSANYRDGWVQVPGLADPVLVQRGQLLTGRYALNMALYPNQRKTDPSPSTTWRWLQSLEKRQNLHIETNSRYSIVTIVNFDVYNEATDADAQPNEQPVNSRRTAGEQPVHTNKKDKKDKKEEKEEKKKISPSASDGGPSENSKPTAFDSWWTLWPPGKKVGKQKARKEYAAAVKRLRVERSISAADAETYLAERLAAFVGTPVGKGKYCPHPERWLSYGRA
jgi:hypothetical protein